MGSIRVRVLYFAQARELAGTKEDEFVLADPARFEHLFSQVMNAHPGLLEIRKIIQPLLNGRAVPENAELKDGDRVALLPPVGGG